MSKTPLSEVRNRLRQGTDVGWAESMYRQALTLIEADKRFSTTAFATELPYFPTITIRELEVGRSRKMLNSLTIVVSRLLSAQLGIKVTSSSRVTASLMEQYFRKRFEEGAWLDEFQSAGLDALAHGLGVLQVGVEDAVKGGQKTDVRHHPLWYTITDPYQKNLNRIGWVCFVHHLSPEDAVALGFRLIDCEEVALSVSNDNGSNAPTRPIIRVYEYFDFKTRALILGSIDGKIGKVEDTPFPGKLPVVFCSVNSSPILSKPFGRVLTEGAAEKFINEIESNIYSQLSENRRMRIVKAEQLNAQDLKKWRSGESSMVRAEGHFETPPVTDIDAQQIDPELFRMLQYAHSQYQEASNMSSLERGVMSSKRQSATEIDTSSAVSAANKSGETSAITGFMKRLAELVFEVGKLWDTAELWVEIQGKEIKMNDQNERNSMLSVMFDEAEYKIVVDVESLTASQDATKRAQALAELRELAPLVGRTITPEDYTARVLEILGEDAADWQPPAPQPLPVEGVPQQGGQPRVEDVARGQLRAQLNAEQR